MIAEKRTNSKEVSWREQSLAQFDPSEGEESTKAVIHGRFKILFATQISLCSEYRRVSQEELDLLDFATRGMA